MSQLRLGFRVKIRFWLGLGLVYGEAVSCDGWSYDRLAWPTRQ